MKINERIKERRKELHLSADYIAQQLGISRASYYRYEKSEVYNMPITALEPLAKILNVTPSYLMGWDDTSPAPMYSQLQPAKYRKYKILGGIACGAPIEAVPEEGEYIETDLTVNADYVLKCQGDSMINARIFDGDYVFIKEQPEVENGEIAAVCMDNTVTLKRIYMYDDYVELRAENPMFKPIIIHKGDYDSVRIIGKAVACQFWVK